MKDFAAFVEAAVEIGLLRIIFSNLLTPPLLQCLQYKCIMRYHEGNVTYSLRPSVLRVANVSASHTPLCGDKLMRTSNYWRHRQSRYKMRRKLIICHFNLHFHYENKITTYYSKGRVYREFPKCTSVIRHVRKLKYSTDLDQEKQLYGARAAPNVINLYSILTGRGTVGINLWSIFCFEFISQC